LEFLDHLSTMSSPLSNPRVGLIAPAGPPLDEGRLAMGITALQKRGLELVRPRPAYPAFGYLAGRDEARLSEFEAICSDTGIDVVFCVRGGYGTLRLLDRIDYTQAAKNPKVLVGYSDITALQLALHTRSGWRGVSGPMVAVEWPHPADSWERPFWELLGSSSGVELRPVDGSVPECLVAGDTEGVCLGGNLAVLARLLGTPYAPDFDGAILFLEDVGERPYRLDGLFAHLQLAGVFTQINGLVLGGFTESDIESGRPSFGVDEVIRQYFDGARFPVVTGWNYGHFPNKVSMPIGVRCALSTSASGTTLATLESLL
jgi:muramoyltetrapeptide carboxypeptidase